MWAIVACNGYVFLQELNAPDPQAFINDFALIPYDLTRNIVLAPPAPPSPWLTLLTSPFLHGGLAHIAANMLFLCMFGPAVETLLGPLRFLALYLACGALAALAQCSVDPMSHVPLLGASGAIAGVLGAHILRFPAALGRAFVIGVWALAQFMHGFGVNEEGGIAYFAHIGGFLAGVFLVGFFATRTSRGRRESRCG